MLSYWEVMNRATNTGELLSQDEFDMRIFKVVSKLVKQYDIKYNKEEIIPDAETCEKVWQAGIEAYAELGTYYIDAERVIRFSREEIEEAIKESEYLPQFITIGTGKEARIMNRRKPLSDVKPVAIGGIVESNPNEGDDFVKIYKSIFKEYVIDGSYVGPAPHTCEGHPWHMGTPWEVQAARNAIGWAREALRGVGRPGLHILDACPSDTGTAANMLAGVDQNGTRPSDSVAIATISEMKTDKHMLNKVALTTVNGTFRNPYWTTVIGGYAGGPEGAAILNVAHALNALMVYRVAGCGFTVMASIMRQQSASTTREALWARSAGMQAVVNNCNMICGGGGLTDAGPGTEQMLWETACMGMTVVASGGHDIHGIRKAVIKKPCQGTGLEARFKAEVSKATAGEDRDTMNHLLDYSFKKFEDNIYQGKSPAGFSFQELYNTKDIVPLDWYMEIYDKVKAELRSEGLKNFK